MTAADLINLISNVGFPIVISGCLLYFITKTMKDITQTLTELQKTIAEHSQVIESLQLEIKINRLTQSHVNGLTQKELEEI